MLFAVLNTKGIYRSLSGQLLPVVEVVGKRVSVEVFDKEFQKNVIVDFLKREVKLVDLPNAVISYEVHIGNSRIDKSGYSRYNERLSLDFKDELPAGELAYGFEQAKSHIAEMRVKDHGEHNDYWRMVPMRIRKYVVFSEDVTTEQPEIYWYEWEAGKFTVWYADSKGNRREIETVDYKTLKEKYPSVTFNNPHP